MGTMTCSEKNEMMVSPLFKKEKSTFISVESTPCILCMYWVYIISKLGQLFCTKWKDPKLMIHTGSQINNHFVYFAWAIKQALVYY